MQITNHKLVGVPFVASPNISGMLDPTYVVMHYTAGWSADSAIATLTNKTSKVSAHLVVDRDGKVTQLVPFNRVAWHAGPSKYDGHNGMNNYAVGIEIVNPGYLRYGPGGEIEESTAAGWKRVPAEKLRWYDLSIVQPHKRVGGGSYIWPAYTKVQIDAVKEIFKALIATYRIVDVVSHEEIDTRGWKTDPGPAFPMKEFKAILHPADRNGGLTALGTYECKVTALNVRRDAKIDSGVLHVLRAGDDVALIKDFGDWSLVEYAPGKQGYVTDKYIGKAA